MEAYKTNYKLYAIKKGIEIRRLKNLPFSTTEIIYILKEIIQVCNDTIELIERK